MDEFAEDMWWDMIDDAILGEEYASREPEDEDINWSSEAPDDSDLVPAGNWDYSGIDFSVPPF
jgi:hypothetical protein